MTNSPTTPLSPVHATANTRTAPHYRRIQADGVDVFYREAGRPDAPVLLLLHGFPSSSHMFRELMPLLAPHYRLIAPDLPGFGFTEVPESRAYAYTFEALAETLAAFVAALDLRRYALYVFDYGAPVGLRLALRQPERVSAFISQNGNAYLEGLGDAWSPIQRYWQEPNAENREALRAILSLEGTRWQYLHGLDDTTAARVAPESYTLDALLMQRPGNAEIQLDLFLDYANNLKLYPAFQAFFRTTQVPTLAIWGRHDPFFIPAGAEAYRRDNAHAVVEFLDTGHFALETHAVDIAARIHATLGWAIA